MMELEKYTNHVHFFKIQNLMILIDIIPAFLKPDIKTFNFPLKIRSDIYSLHDIENSYKFKFIKENIKKFNIPNLNDWQLNIHQS